jgi:hypothetical protein
MDRAQELRVKWADWVWQIHEEEEMKLEFGIEKVTLGKQHLGKYRDD